MGLAADLGGSFFLGLATPLTAVCVIPLYPGFLAYLSRQSAADGPSIAALAALVGAGVLAFMTAVGIVFTTVLRTSLTGVVGVVSPAAFLALGIASLFLLADVDVGERLPAVEPPGSDSPALSAFGYGAFFGAIVLPCNPGFIGVFFARAFLFAEPVPSLLNFLAFGLGIVAPLIGLAVASDRRRSRVLGTLTAHESAINRATGAVMLAVSAYYLLFVFEVAG